MAKVSRKKKGMSIKELRVSNDPMMRFYDHAQEWLQDKGRPLVIGIGVVVGLILLYTVGSYFFQYRKDRAAAAFAQAFEVYNAPVQDPTTVSTNAVVGKSYNDDATKWQESADAFERLANDYSSFRALGRYYAGVSYLHLDNSHDKGVSLLEQTAGMNDQPSSDLARLALAEYYATQGNTEKSLALYQQLMNSANLLKPAIQYAMGRVYEKSGDKQKAIDSYFEAAKADRATGNTSDAEKRLSALAPDRIKELPPPTETPFQP